MRTLTLCVILLNANLLAAEPEWTGDGAYRVLVEVPATDLGGRASDEMVASIALPMTKLLRDSGVGSGSVDVSTLQVHRYDPATGEAQPFGAGGLDWPCRYDDAAVPATYKSRVGRPSQTEDGRARAIERVRKARLFNRLQDNTDGTLVWPHLQRGDDTAHYAVYFDLVEVDQAYGVSPAPWIGDFDVLRRAEGQAIGGFAHFMATVGDLNGDGLFDLVAGTEKGDVMWFPNLGKPGEPLFLGCHLLFDDEGAIDTGWYASPLVYDWNGDGLPDIILGSSGNVLLWWKNVGRTDAPRFAYAGFVQADGGRLEVPQGPVAEDPSGLFKADYYNQPWLGDFDGDGNLDLITGGYVTGRIFHYRAVGRESDGTPKLTFVGELHADGEPIDTTWAASPGAADFDGDGDVDLVTGSWWWSGIHHDPEPGQVDYVMYFRNDGAASEPKLTHVPLPSSGELPRGNIARPTPVDWNDDGLIDLMVSDHGGPLYVFLNEGTRDAPRFALNDKSLTVPWGFDKGFSVTGTKADFGGDGVVETMSYQTVFRVEGDPRAPRNKPVGRIHVNGKPIHHPGPGYGDAYAYPIAADWDGDGAADVLWGTQQGEVYFHRGIQGDQSLALEEGVALKLNTGETLRVGPPIVASAREATDFTILQGSRIVLLVTDFDGDGIDDLVVTETFGNIWVFLNTVQGGVDTLQPGVAVAKMPTRTNMLSPIDWNKDGLTDLFTGGTAAQPGEIRLNQSKPGQPAIGDPIRPIDTPYLWWGPKFRITDWNGDGDDDMMVNSEFFTFFAERSFLDHGYRPGRLIDDAKPVRKRK